MKRLTTIFFSICLLLSIQMNAQVYQTKEINANKILTTLSSNGSLFFDPEEGLGTFIGPNEAGADMASTMFAGALWIGGIDPIGNLKLSASVYGGNNGQIFSPGPIDELTGQPFELLDFFFNRVWSINRTDILALKEDIADGSIEGNVANDIIRWPAKGNSYFNGALDNQNVAPFYDHDNNGLYDPYAGDHPIIGDDFPDVIPDQFIYTIYNDYNSASPDGNAGVEVHAMFYALHCDENEALNHTVFSRHRIINRNNVQLNDLRIGHWLDGDLGCYTDDYLGCDPSRNMIYFYNEDLLDGTVGNECDGGVQSFLAQVPVQSTTFLNKEIGSMGFYNNSGIGSYPPQTVDPNQANEYFQYLNGNWRDGTPMTVGGSGFNPGSSDETKFVFPDNPNDPTGWSMFTVDLPFGDRRSITSQYFESFAPGQIITLDAAHTLSRKLGSNHVQNVDFAMENSDAIQSLYDQKFDMGCTQKLLCEGENCVYPGDVNNNEIVEQVDLMAMGIAIAKAQGFSAPRDFIASKWDEFEANQRSESFANGVNFNHADCNGDGEINEADFAVATQNYQLTSRNYTEHNFGATEYPSFGNIFVAAEDTVDVDNTFVYTGDIEFLNLENIHSISYEFEYDSSIFTTFSTTTAMLDTYPLDDSDLGFTTNLESGRDIVFHGSKGNGNINLNGSIGVRFALKPIGGTSDNATQITLKNILIMDYDENLYYLEDQVFDIKLEGVTVSTKDLLDDEVNIYPNPSNGVVHIHSNTQFDGYQVFDIYGRLVKKGSLAETNKIQMNQQNGLYFLQLMKEGNLSFAQKILIEK